MASLDRVIPRRKAGPGFWPGPGAKGDLRVRPREERWSPRRGSAGPESVMAPETPMAKLPVDEGLDPVVEVRLQLGCLLLSEPTGRDRFVDRLLRRAHECLDETCNGLAFVLCDLRERLVSKLLAKLG